MSNGRGFISLEQFREEHPTILYVSMAGMKGCIPNWIQEHSTREDAEQSIISLHRLGWKRKRVLKKNGYIELNLKRDGNEYAEIVERAVVNRQ